MASAPTSPPAPPSAAPVSPAAAPASPAAGAAPAATVQPRRRRGLLAAACLILIVAAAFLFHWFTYRFSHSITDDAFVEAHIVNVAPEMVSGHIVRMLVEENDQVIAGQVLAE